MHYPCSTADPHGITAPGRGARRAVPRHPLRRWSACLLLPGLLLAGSTGCGGSSARQDADGPAPSGSQLPHLSADSAGRPVLSWVQSGDRGHALVYAVLGEAGWSPAVTVAEGTDWFVNWADIPSVKPLSEDVWAAHWLVKQPGGMYAYDIALSLSRDGGRNWARPFTPHDDGTPTEHGFVSLWPARLPDGGTGVGALWLDGRNMVLDPSRAETIEPRTMLRSAVFDAGGARVRAAEVDQQVCDCCQTDAVVTGEGPVVVYRDRSENEVRDIRAARADPAGWHDLGIVAEDHWVIGGCPVNGPSIASRDGRMAAAWYTEAAGERQVKLSWSSDGGAAWSPARVVENDGPLGRVDVALLPDGDAAVSWMAPGDEGVAWILLARVQPEGTVGEPLRVAVTEASRPAGFPRMIPRADGLLLAWTRWQDGVPRVVTATVRASELPYGE